MSKDELKKIIDEALDTDSVIDAIDPPEVAVYTQVWIITSKQIDTLKSKGVDILSIYVEGFHISLRVRI